MNVIDGILVSEFAFLTNDPRTKVIERIGETVILQQGDVLIRCIHDRNDFFTDVASITDPDQWTDLYHLLHVLYSKKDIAEYVKTINKPAARAANLKKYLPIVHQHFGVDHYQKTKTALAISDRSAGLLHRRFYSNTIIPIQKVYNLVNNLDYEEKFRKYAPQWSTVAINKDGLVVGVIRHASQPTIESNQQHLDIYPNTTQFTAWPGRFKTIEDLEKELLISKKLAHDY